MKVNYSIGDTVIVSKVWVCDPHGRFKSVDPIKAKVVDVTKTRSNGPAYTLKIGLETAKVCYWYEDIDGIPEEDPDAIWKLFGDQ